MKKIILISFITLFAANQIFAQEEKKFEVNAMVGMHHYSSSFFHAINTVTWVQDPAGNFTDFSGYGTSILPAVNVSYYFNTTLGVTAGITPITAENDLYVDDATGTYYDYSADQFNINLGVSGRVFFDGTPLSLNMGSGFIFAPFDISQNIESSAGGSYLEGSDVGAGFYGNASFQIKIFSFMQYKTQFSYSYIPASITLNDTDGNVEQNINNLNVGGITLKTGFSFHF